MLQLQVLRLDPDGVKRKLAIKHFRDLDLVDLVIGLDDQRKKAQLDFDNTQSQVNSISKEIGKLMGAGQKEEAESKKKEVAALKSSVQSITAMLNDAEKKLQDELVKLPNLPSDLVPQGKEPSDNVVVKEGGKKPTL